MQLITVFFILSCAVAYVGWRIYVTIRRQGDACYGCKGCAIHDQMLKNMANKKGKQSQSIKDCPNKDRNERKVKEKFGGTK